MKIPTVALIGRTNVGKSTLFNRLSKQRISIVEDFPGVTRDRIYSKIEHNDVFFHLVDTGGITLEKDDFNKDIKLQAEIAIDEADVILFVVDAKEGVSSDDLLITNMLRKKRNDVIVVLNKVDSKKSRENLYDFYSLGFNEQIEVSAEHNINISDLLDLIVSKFGDLNQQEYDEEIIKFSIIGRPNVGKSSLVNAILNEERCIVSDIAGTTRDSLDTMFNYNKKKYVVIDTAGIKKHGKIYEEVERYSILRSLKAIDRSDVCVIVLDAEQGIIEQDKHIAGYALESNKAVVLVMNKIDKSLLDINTYKKEIESHFNFMTYAPVLFMSALTKKRVNTLMPEILNAYEKWNTEVKTSILNDIINDATLLKPAPSFKGKRLKIFYVNQIDTKPPKFLFHVNDKKLIHFSYERYLENKIRESIDLKGSPIILQFKNRND